MKFVSLILVVAFALPLAPRAAAAPEQSTDSVLVFTFENTSRRQEYNWIGESFAEMLSELLDSTGIESIRPDERNLAYEREGLPPTSVLTRATSIKIGERAEADLIVLGTYRVDGEPSQETITVSARVIDIREGRIIGTELTHGGLLKDLQAIQGEMAYEILSQKNRSLAFSKGELVSAATSIPPEAYADYMKAILTADRQNKILFLARAIETYGKKNRSQYDQAVFELGRVFYLEGDWENAITWLSRIEDSYPRSREASFYLGVAQARAGKNAEAQKIFSSLVPKMPLYEVYNNAGVAHLRLGKLDDAIIYLKPAAEAATRDLDVQFNYGYALWLKGDHVAAAQQLQKAVRKRSNDARTPRPTEGDGEAYYLLAKSGERSGNSALAAESLDQAKRLLPNFAKWETGTKIPDLSRLKARFSKTAYIRYLKDRRVLEVDDSSTSGSDAVGGPSVNEAMANARARFAENRDREALDELARVLQVNPDNAEAHLLRGRIYERSGNYEKAIESFKAATFWNPKELSAYVQLGRIYVFKNDCPNAQSTMRKALQIDPTSQDVLALKRSVESRCR